MGSTSRRGLFTSLVFAITVFLGLAGVATAQQVFGSIYGTITDPTGSAVNNAKVTITDTNKQTSFVVMTNESGAYSKGQLIPDPYKVTIEAPGFQKVTSNEIPVSVDQAAKFDAALKVGDVNQTVEVTAAAPLLQTDRADVAQTFTSQQLSQLPNIGRNVQSFELLNPGTVKLPWQHASSENPQGSVQTMVNGQYFASTGYYLDGTINQDPILGIIVVNPTMDSVQEVKQANQDFDAEYGYMGAGLLTYSTKSGTNTFHGDAFEYLFINTPGFQDFARNPFNSAENNGVPTVHQNQFGGSIGGRIIKDKLFFFGDAQLTRNHQGSSLVTTVPTAQDRTGDLSDWLRGSASNQIYDPATGNQSTGLGRTPFVNNVIPQNRLTPQALAILKYFPLPNTVDPTSGASYFNNYSVSGTDIIEGNQWNTRWDYYANEKNTLFGRYSYAKYSQNAPGAFTSFNAIAGGPSFPVFGFAGNSDALNQSIAFGHTYTASPTTINEFRFGYMRYHVVVTPAGIGTAPATQAGIPNLNQDNFYTSGMPNFYIHAPGGSDQGQNGSIQLGYALNNNRCNCPLTELEQQYQFVDNLSHIRGNHNLKFGVDARYATNLRVPSDNHRSGELNFSDGTTGTVDAAGNTTGGLGLASFLLGDVNSFSRYVSSSTDASERQKRLFFYGQDSWRITPKLTATYGVRWELVFPETINHPGQGAALNLADGNIDVFGVGLISDSGYQAMNWHNFAPRIGLAYQITPKTVIRAGYGWTYSLGTFGSTFGHNITQNPPVLSNQNLNTSSFGSVFTLAQGPPSLNTASITPNAYGTFRLPDGIDAKARPAIFTMPVVYAYNFTIQHQLASKVSVSAAYVGNSGRHGALGTSQSFNRNEPAYIPGDPNTNIDGRPYYPVYGWTQNIDYYCNCANNRYDSLQAIFQVRGAAGYNLQGNYTYQIAQGDGFGSAQSWTFLYNRALGYGYADNIPHHQLTLSQDYDIPFGRNRKWGSHINPVIDAVLGGWNISGITQFYSGIPFNPTLGNSPTVPVGPGDRPNEGSVSPYQGAKKDRSQWFIPGIGSAFLLPATGTFGRYPINQLYGPHFIDQAASLMKVFSLTEKYKFTLRADATNLFNHANLGQPNNNVQDTKNGGKITGLAQGNAYLMRRLQYSATITF